MKKITSICLALISVVLLFAQAPQAFKYQAVVRNSIGEIISNEPVGIRISIHDVTVGGTIIYQETFLETTNQFGLVNLEIGNGIATIGTFPEIDWSSNSKFLEIEIDLAGGSTYVSVGTSELLSVPYSLYSESTGDTTRWRKNNDDLYFNNGNVGIGTDSPSSWAKLDVKGNLLVDDGNAVISHTDATESFLNIYNIVSDWELVAASDNNRFDIRKWGGVPALSISDNNFIGIGTINPNAKLDIRGTGTDDAAMIRIGNSDGSHSLSFFPGRENDPNPFIQWKEGDPLRFSTDEGGWSEKMRITGDGKVGIGTTEPLTKLHIENEDISLVETDLLNELITVVDSDAGFGLYSIDDGNYGSLINLGEIVSGSLNNKWTLYRTTSIADPANQLRFSFGSNVNYNQNPAWMTISENGNVGIGGALQPEAKLEVEVHGLDGIHIDGDDTDDARLSIENGGGNHYIFDDDDDSHAFKMESASGTDLVFNTDGPTERMRINSNGYVGIGTDTPSANLYVEGIDGVVFTGDYGYGTIPVEGTGARMMWYGRKCAFRVGEVIGESWDDENIGSNSFATGFNTQASASTSAAFGMYTHASGGRSFAMGYGSHASGTFSVAMGLYTDASDTATTSMGYITEASGFSSLATGYRSTASGRFSITTGDSTLASGYSSIAMGSNSEAIEDYAVAIGKENTASGYASVAMGNNTEAQGTYSTAMGSYVTAQEEGAFAIGDNSTATITTFAIANTFNARFANGYRLYTVSGSPWIGAKLGAGANSWETMSDSSKKENIQAVNSEEILMKISQFKLSTWNYIGQDPSKFRHYGPMAQDFYAAFGHDGIGAIGCDTLLSSADFDGINFIAIQALEKRTSKLQSENEQLKQELAMIKSEMERFESLLRRVEDLSAINKREDQEGFANSK